VSTPVAQDASWPAVDVMIPRTTESIELARNTSQA
jgi:hypothetical protein